MTDLYNNKVAYFVLGAIEIFTFSTNLRMPVKNISVYRVFSKESGKIFVESIWDLSAFNNYNNIPRSKFKRNGRGRGISHETEGDKLQDHTTEVRKEAVYCTGLCFINRIKILAA